MDDKIRCQSCGMPIEARFQNLGTNADGSANQEYCMFCFKNGAFTQPNQTMEEMIASSISFMSSSMEFTEKQAHDLSWKVIPELRRWKHA